MFNYQSKICSEVWNSLNLKHLNGSGIASSFLDGLKENLQRSADVVYEHLPENIQQSPIVREFYEEWNKCYKETYDWVNPKLTELSNTSLHYGTGVSVGVIASILILVFIVTKFLPGKLKNLGYILMLFGTSASLFFLTSVNNFIKDPVANTFVENWQYFVGYIVISGLLSFALVYRYGPVTDARTLSLIQWFLQGIGLVLVYNSTQIREVSIALILILLTVYNFPRKLFFCERIRNRWYRFFPPKIKLLTEEEYIRQGNIETNKELEKLRAFCRSPECQSWKIISKLKSPQRFAEFVIQGAWHISATEIMDYEHGDYMDTSDNEAQSATESELVFVLGSTDRTVKI